MKYLTCYFFICIIISYISATAINLQSSTIDPCGCRAALQDLVRTETQHLQSLKDINSEFIKVDSKINNVIDPIVNNQTDRLCSLQDDLKALIKRENSTIIILNEQTIDLKRIYDDLCEVCENTEDLEEIATQQKCILTSIQKSVLVALEECRGENCQGQLGAKA